MSLRHPRLLIAAVAALLWSSSLYAGTTSECTNDSDCGEGPLGSCFVPRCIEGSCTEGPAPAGTLCGPLVECVGELSPGDCTDHFECDAFGGCQGIARPDGADCSNGCDNATCQSGACVAGTAVVCPESACNTVACVPFQGGCFESPPYGCINTPVADDTVCDDENDCTGGDVCQSGSCVGDSAVADGDPCGDQDTDTECDALDSCLSGNCEDNLAANGDPCGEAGTSLCNAADSCDGDGECLANLSECGFVTGGGTCLFDKYPEIGVCDGGKLDGSCCVVGEQESDCADAGGSCAANRDFRLVFTPDVSLWPAHKLNASNPGQYRYNVYAAGTAGETQTTSISIPFPFVTQGAVPVHVYDALGVANEEECFAFGDEVGGFSPIITAADWVEGGTNDSGVTCDQACGPLDGPNAARCTFEVEYEVPASGMAYIQVHLDYGLKGVFANGNPCDTLADRYDPSAPDGLGLRDALENNSTQDGPVRITSCQPYEFESVVDGQSTSGDTVWSVNEFKRVSGVLGLVAKSADGSGVAGATVELLRGGKTVSRTTTDADGYYLLAHRHKGKATSYTVRLVGATTLSQQVVLKANGRAEVNFDLTSSSATAKVSSGR